VVVCGDLVCVQRAEFDSSVHVVSLVGMKRLQVVDGHLQDLGLLQLGRARFFEGLRDEPLEFVEGAVDPIPTAFFDDPASAFAVRVPVGLAAAGYRAVAAVLLGAVVAVAHAEAVTPLHVDTVHPFCYLAFYQNFQTQRYLL